MKKIGNSICLLLLLLLTACGGDADLSNAGNNENEPASEQNNNAGVDDSNSMSSMEAELLVDLNEEKWGHYEAGYTNRSYVFEEEGIFFMNPMSRFYVAYDAEDNADIWQYSRLTENIENPIYNEADRLVFAQNRSIVGLSKADGSYDFDIDLPQFQQASQLVQMENHYAIILEAFSDDATVYADKLLLAVYDRETQDEVLSQEVHLASDVYRYPLLAYESIVYYLSDENALTAVDVETGETVWEHQLDEALTNYPFPIQHEDQIYVFDDSHALHSFDALTGEQLLELATGIEHYFQNSVDPIVNADSSYVYDHDKGRLIAFDNDTSEQKWILNTDEHYLFGMWSMDDHLLTFAEELENYKPNPKTFLLKIDAENGEILQKIELPERMTMGVTYSGSTFLYEDLQAERIYLVFGNYITYFEMDI